MSHYNITVPPGGHSVVPQCHRMLFPVISIYLGWVSLIIWRCPQKAIYFFLVWLCNVFIGKAVTKSVQQVSSSAVNQKWKEHADIAFRQVCQFALS